MNVALVFVQTGSGRRPLVHKLNVCIVGSDSDVKKLRLPTVQRIFFPFQQGERSTIAFLKFFIMNKHPPLKPEFLQKQSDEKVPYILEDN